MTTAQLTPRRPPAGPSPVEAKLRGAWRRERWYCHLRGLAPLLMAVIGLFLVSLLLDWLFSLPGPARLVLLLLNLTALGVLGYRLWWRFLRPYDPVRVALQVERLHPGLKSLLVSYVQFNAGSHGSQRLIEAVRGQAVQTAGPLDFRGVVRFARLRRLLLAAAALLLLFAVSAVFAVGVYRVAAERLINPLSAATYPTWAHIESVTGDVVAPLGAPVDLEARVGGAAPSQGALFVRFGDAAWEKITVDGDERVFAHRFPRPGQSFQYYFQIGDARSSIHRTTVVAPPRIKEAHVALHYPQYIGRADETLDTLHLSAVPEGTAVEWRIRCDQELKAGRLEVQSEGGATLDLVIDESDPHWARLTVPDVAALIARPEGERGRLAARATAYHLSWTERMHGFTFADPTRYTLEVLPDRPPTAMLLKPRPGAGLDRMPATVRKRLDMTLEARDDHGLGLVWLVYRVNDGPEKREKLGRFEPGVRHAQTDASWVLRQSIAELKEGDEVALAVEVEDNRMEEGKPKPNLGRSAMMRMQIVSDEEYQRHVAREKERGFDRTREATREESEGAKKVKLLLATQGEKK